MTTDPRIRFSPDGAVLIYAKEHQVQCWHLPDRRLLHQHDGTLIGMARDARSFLLESSDTAIRAYDLHAGTPIPIDSIPVQDYPNGQRYVLRRNRHSIEVLDALRSGEILTVQPADLIDTSSGNPSFTNASLSPDGSFVALTIEGDSTWGEWARGYCLHINGEVHFEFSLNSTVHRPVVQTAGYYLMVETTARKREVWDMQTGEKVQTIAIADHRNSGNFLAVNEAEPPPVAALHVDRCRVDLHRARVLVARLTPKRDVYAAEFCPDNRHIALLLENDEVAFYEWRTARYKGSLTLTGSSDS